MIIETWIAAIIVIFISALCVILGFGNMRLTERLEKALKANEAYRNEIRRLKVELMMKTTDEFCKEGKKKK